MLTETITNDFIVCAVITYNEEDSDEWELELLPDAEAAKHYAREFLIDFENNPETDPDLAGLSSVYVAEAISAGQLGDPIFEDQPRRPNPNQTAFTF